ncbi:MAG TPA: glycosyltransferase [Verrucomicrobiota bacterium]|nr:hypothetical protein [Verrucomicrobiales bacterium]HRI12257.1 glycosyltransferase [Verrucomicrobiota bacterium]
MPVPFFSVLLPTKNRAIILGDAIRSVIGQTFADWELIVSDNDDSPTATQEVVSEVTDPRIRYFRTSGRLPMHENWESAFNQSRGQHVLVLEDKQRLNLNALETLHRILIEQPEAVITYPVVVTHRESLPPAPADLKPVPMRSVDLLRRYCSFDEDSWQYLPRGLNSSAPSALLRQLQRVSPTGQVFSYLAPDHSQAYQVLSHRDVILHLPGDIIYIPMSLRKKGTFSNGLSCIRKDESARRWFNELPVPLANLLTEVPVKTHWMPLNVILYDFRVFLRRSDFTPEFDWVRYHGLSLYMVLLGKLWRCDMSPEWMAIRSSLKQHGFGFRLKVVLDVLRRLVVAIIRRLGGDRRL